MKILYDHQIFNMQKYGGISRYFYEIIKYISKSEKTHIFKGFNDNKYPIDETNYNRLFSMRKLPSLPHTGINRVMNLANKVGINMFVQNDTFDIYHPTYYSDFDLQNGKLIVTVYDMIHELFPEQFVGDKTSMNKLNILNKADGIIAISEWTKKDLIKIFNIPEEKIKVIYLANSLCENVNSKRIIEDEYILYVGNRAGYKNYTTYVEGFAKVANKYSNLKCICFGGPDFSENEKKLHSKLNIENRVNHVSGKDVTLANLYKYAKVFVYPSIYEGFGLPPLEAMHYGVPVIASSASCIPEVVGSAALLFDPYSSNDLSLKIMSIMDDKILRNNIIEHGYFREKEFSWERCGRETLEYYKEVISR